MKNIILYIIYKKESLFSLVDVNAFEPFTVILSFYRYCIIYMALNYLNLIFLHFQEPAETTAPASQIEPERTEWRWRSSPPEKEVELHAAAVRRSHGVGDVNGGRGLARARQPRWRRTGGRRRHSHATLQRGQSTTAEATQTVTSVTVVVRRNHEIEFRGYGQLAQPLSGCVHRSVYLRKTFNKRECARNDRSIHR